MCPPLSEISSYAPVRLYGPDPCNFKKTSWSYCSAPLYFDAQDFLSPYLRPCLVHKCQEFSCPNFCTENALRILAKRYI